MADNTIRVIDQVVTDRYSLYNGDSMDVLRDIPESSIHYTITSIPFADLYSYSAVPQDVGNCRDHAEFWEHMNFMIGELLRVTMPGRLLSMHVMNLPRTKERDGFIGLRDFRGHTIRKCEEHGWIYHSEVCIYKDPLVAATRTKALGLLHKQIVKDSAMCRQGIPDYLVTFRKPGVNPEPVSHKPNGFQRWIGPPEDEPRANRHPDPRKNEYSHHVWQRYADPIWTDIDPSDTLQFRSAREPEDMKHICPLQLTVIRRGIELWSNPGDIVLDPFNGIGSTGVVAVGDGRRHVGIELKPTFHRQAVKNLAEALKKQGLLFSDPDPDEQPEESRDWPW